MNGLKIFLLLIATAFIAVVIVLSGIMNYRFGSSFGATPFDRELLGYVALAIDGWKSMLPVIAGIAILAGRRGLWAGAWMMWSVAAILSVSSTFGFVVQSREDTRAMRQASVERRAELKAERRDVVKATKRLRARPLAVVQADYETRCDTDRRKRWRSCKRLKRELGRARAIHEGRTIRTAIDSGVSQIAVRSGDDQQVNIISRIVSKTPFAVMVLIAALFAVIVEIVTGFGPAMLLAAFHHARLGAGEAVSRFHLPGFLARFVARKNRTPTEPDRPDPDGGRHEGGVRQEPVPPASAGGEQDKGVSDHSSTGFIRSLLQSADRRENAGGMRRLAAAVGVVTKGRAGDFFADIVRPGPGRFSGVEVFEKYQRWCRDRDVAALPFADFHDEFAALVDGMGSAVVSADPRGRRFADKIVYTGIVLTGVQTSGAVA